MFTISQMHDLQAERAEKMAAAHGVGAALALAVQAKAEHDAHTARHERWSNCEFCELATLQAAAEWQQQQREEQDSLDNDAAWRRVEALDAATE